MIIARSYCTGSDFILHLHVFWFPLLSTHPPDLLKRQYTDPWFGANEFNAVIIPIPNGGLLGQGNVSWTFNDGGAFEFSSIYGQLRSRMNEELRAEAEAMAHGGGVVDEPLPLYSSN